MIGALKAAGDIHISAALFGEACSGRSTTSELAAAVGFAKNVAGDEVIELFEVFGFEAGFLEEVFLEDDERFDCAGANSFANRVEVWQQDLRCPKIKLAPVVLALRSAETSLPSDFRLDGERWTGVRCPRASAIFLARKSSSLLMRPEAMTATSLAWRMLKTFGGFIDRFGSKWFPCVRRPS